MAKRTFSLLVCFVGLLISVSVLNGQGSKKTITLPNGDVVCDLNGEWDALYDHPRLGKSTDILKMTQRDGSFQGVKLIGGLYVPKNAVSTKGELSKDGIVKVQVVTRILYSGDPVTEKQELRDCKGQISEDGNKITIDCGETIRVTLTRK